MPEDEHDEIDLDLWGLGHEKLVRVYDLGRPDAPPQQFAQAPGKVRCLVWAANDTLLLSSDIDDPNITCALACSTSASALQC